MKKSYKIYFILLLSTLSFNMAFAQVDIDSIDVNDINRDAIEDFLENPIDEENDAVGSDTLPPAAPDIVIETPAQQEPSEEEILLEENDSEVRKRDSISAETKVNDIPVYPPLGIFGHDFYRNNNFNFYRAIDDVVVGDDYIIGKGDEMTVTVWNQDNVISDKYTVDNIGSISKVLIGKIYVEGMTFGRAKEVIRSRYARSYTFQPNNFDVVMSGVRKVSVDITGDVTVPGTFTFPAANTIINVLKLAGGPNKNGSSRNIYLRRAGKVIYTFDTYEYLLDPNFSTPLYLMDNDIIHVGAIGELVEINGAVRKPNRYELKNNESFTDLLKFSGGLKAEASRQTIPIFRFDDGAYLLKTFPFNDGRSNIDLRDGDRIEIGAVEEIVVNEVVINGAIKQPGPYEYQEDMRLSDLIEASSGLRFDAVKDRAYITRLNDNLMPFNIPVDLDDALNNKGSEADIYIYPKDKVQVLSRQNFIKSFIVSIDGASTRNGDYQYSEGMRVSDLVDRANGLDFNALKERAYLHRENENFDPTNIVIQLDEAINNPDSESNIVLFPNDKLTILNQKDYVDISTVEIHGEVKRPGSYTFSNNFTLKDLIILAGGFKTAARSTEVELRRVMSYNEEEDRVLPSKSSVETFNIDFNYLTGDSGESIELLPYDQVFIRTVADYEIPTLVSLLGEIEYPGLYPMTSKNMRISDVLADAGGLTAYAAPNAARFYRNVEDSTIMIVLDLNQVQRNVSSRYNYILRPGDKLEIPTIDNIVSIEGAIRSVLDDKQLINTAYHGKKNAKWYIDEFAAGFDKRADRKTTQVLDPNGKLNGTRRFLFFNIYPDVEPGSEINVSYKPEKKTQGEGRFFRDFSLNSAIAVMTAMTTTALAVIAATK